MTTMATDRREFIIAAARTVGVSLCGLAIGSLVQSCETDAVRPADITTSGSVVKLDIGAEPDLATTGGAIKRTFGSNNNGSPVMIIRLAETSFMVFTAVCTHQGTIINLPKAGSNVMVCPRHEEEFLVTDGVPQTDTAPRPLQSFPSVFDPTTQVLSITF